MIKPEYILYGVGAFLAFQLLTRNKGGEIIGGAIGEGVGGAVGGAATGLIKSITINPYEWAKNYEGYIPIIDPLAKSAVWFKRLGSDEHWLW